MHTPQSDKHCAKNKSAAKAKISTLRGRYRSKGLLKALAAEKKRERRV